MLTKLTNTVLQGKEELKVVIHYVESALLLNPLRLETMGRPYSDGKGV